MNYLITGLLAFFWTLNLHAANTETIGFSLSEPVTEGMTAPVHVMVHDDSKLKSLAGAHVEIQSSFTEPAEMQGDTNNQGEWTAANITYRTPKIITVSKNGFTTVSVAGVLNKKIHIYLKETGGNTPTVMSSGSVQDWKTPNLGKVIYAGVVFPNISAYDFIRFNQNLFVSPLRDTIDVFGPKQIPSNVAFPEQDISVILGSVHLDKPEYRLPVLANRELRLVGLQGELAVRDAISLIGGNNGAANLELINSMKITQLGMTDVLRTHEDFTADARLTVPLRPKFKVTIHPPPFKSDVFVAAISDLDGNRRNLIPTDIKVPLFASKPGTIKPVDLNSPETKLGTSEHVMTVAVSKPPKMVTGILTANAAAGMVKPGNYLPIYQLNLLSDFFEIQAPASGMGALVFDTAHPVWIVYALPAAQKVRVPKKIAIGKYNASYTSTVQLEFGPNFNPAEVDGTRIIEKLSRFAATLYPLQDPLPEALPNVTIDEGAIPDESLLPNKLPFFDSLPSYF
jgi:hypothetical protein